jgi:hypothetical protein
MVEKVTALGRYDSLGTTDERRDIEAAAVLTYIFSYIHSPLVTYTLPELIGPPPRCERALFARIYQMGMS